MKQSDRILLDGLRSTVLADIPQSHWEEVEKAVEDAGDVREVSGYARTIVFDAIEVAKASFATRSEAGRYAANMRWRGSVSQGGVAANEARMAENARLGRGADNPARGGISEEKLRRKFDRYGDGEGPQNTREELQGFIDRGYTTRAQMNEYDKKVLDGEVNPSERFFGKPSDKKPFLDLTDIDPSGSMESGSAKPASAKPTKTSEVKPETVTRIKEGNLSDISRVIRRDLKAQNKKVPFGAEPYLEALDTMDDIGDMYGADRGSSIVAYALSNLSSYKGPVAREVKAELKRRLKAKK